MVAGIGCRRGCSVDEILILLRRAQGAAGPVDAVAVPEFRADEAGPREAARQLGVPLLVVARAVLQRAQGVTHSAVSFAATGLASVAEAAAIGEGGVLVLPRIASAAATCAVARHG